LLVRLVGLATGAAVAITHLTHSFASQAGKGIGSRGLGMGRRGEEGQRTDWGFDGGLADVLPVTLNTAIAGHHRCSRPPLRLA